MGFHIIVCIKAVMLQSPKKGLIRSPDALELNPFDRPALETALQMKEERGGTVTALSMGPDACASSLYEAMAMGVDRNVLISDPAVAGSDTLATSTALAAAVKKLSPYELLLFGTRSADSDTGQVGPQTAVVLDIPLVTWAHSIENKGAGLRVERRADGFLESFEVSFPAALTIHPGAVQARHVGLAGIEQAFSEGKMEKWGLSDLDLAADQVGWAGSPTRVVSWDKVVREKKCAFLSGSVEEQVGELVRRLVDSGAVA
jgi:electron transfer flavoprotein beta subunit